MHHITRSTRLRAAVLASALAFVGGCSIFGTLEPEESDELAVIINYTDSMRVMVADTVVQGTGFLVQLNTFGDFCTNSIVRTDVVITGRVAEIRPYNHKSVVNQASCSGDLHTLRHEKQLSVDGPGTFTIRVYGQERYPSGGGALRSAQIQRVIVVR